MERLLLLDAKDYDDDKDVWARIAVRGIVFIGDKLLLLNDNKGEVSLPGGGQDEGESDAEPLSVRSERKRDTPLFPIPYVRLGISRKSEGISRAITMTGYSTRSADCIFARYLPSVEKRSSANRKRSME